MMPSMVCPSIMPGSLLVAPSTAASLPLVARAHAVLRTGAGAALHETARHPCPRAQHRVRGNVPGYGIMFRPPWLVPIWPCMPEASVVASALTLCPVEVDTV